MYNICLKYLFLEGRSVKRLEIAALYTDAAQYAGQTVTVCGWVKTIRDSKALGFIELNDGSCFRNLQVVLEENKVAEFKDVVKYNVGSAVIVTGSVLLTPQAKQPLEIHADSVILEGASSPDYPLQKKRHSLEFLRSIAHLRPRTNTFSAVFRVRSAAAFAIHQFFHENGFLSFFVCQVQDKAAGQRFDLPLLHEYWGRRVFSFLPNKKK